MSLEDLEQAGVTLPRKEWGRFPVHCLINRPLFVIALAIEMFSCVAMYLGDGHLLTWIGAASFLVALYLLVVVLLRGMAPKSRIKQPD